LRLYMTQLWVKPRLTAIDIFC